MAQASSVPISEFFHNFAGHDCCIRNMRRTTIRYEISDLREVRSRPERKVSKGRIANPCSLVERMNAVKARALRLLWSPELLVIGQRNSFCICVSAQ
jgi:hypothetical protein